MTIFIFFFLSLDFHEITKGELKYIYNHVFLVIILVFN